MSRPVLVIGAGGHASVVADALLTAGETVLGFTDVEPSRHGETLCGLPILGDDRVLESHSPGALALANGLGGVGDLRSAHRRRDVQEKLSERGWSFVIVRHPAAVVSRFAHLDAGAQVMAGSVVQASARIGKGCIVNTGAIIEHGVVLGDWVHVAPRALVCGDVQVGASSHIGAGAVIRQGLHLGAQTVVGAGAVVVRNFDGGVVVGVPARQVRNGS